MKNDKIIRAMLQFLSASSDEKLGFLPTVDPNTSYQWNDAGDTVENPLLYYCNAIYELTDRFYSAEENEFSKLIKEICCVLAIMIEQRRAYGFIWHLDKRGYGILGPADRIWDVLRRLATEALRVKGWPAGVPEIPFAETGRSGMWTPENKT